MRIQRYHLFPCLGLVLMLSSWVAPRLRRLDGRPGAGPLLVLCLALILIAVNRPLMKMRMKIHHLLPDQRPVLAMMDSVANLARSRGLARDQVIRAFEPLEPRWSLAGSNILRMLPEVSGTHPGGVNSDQVRAVVLEGLSNRDRRLIFADMNATSLLEPRVSSAQAAGSVPGLLVDSFRIHPLDRTGHYRADGWPSHLEFLFSTVGPSPRALSLPGLATSRTMEIWWAEDDRWSSDRCVVLRLDQPTEGRLNCILPLDRLPNLEKGAMSRVRITFRESGMVAMDTPELMR